MNKHSDLFAGFKNYRNYRNSIGRNNFFDGVTNEIK